MTILEVYWRSSWCRIRGNSWLFRFLHLVTSVLLKQQLMKHYSGACRFISRHQPITNVGVTLTREKSAVSVEDVQQFSAFLRRLNSIASVTQLYIDFLGPYEAGLIIDELKRCRCIKVFSCSVTGVNVNSIVEALQSWVPENRLEYLWLRNCELLVNGASPLLAALPQSLAFLHLSGNVLTGSLHKLPVLPTLSFLALSRTCLDKDDILSLYRFVEERKFPELRSLWLAENNLHSMTDALKKLIQSCVNTHTKDLKIKLYENKLPDEFRNYCAAICKSCERVTLFFWHSTDEMLINLPPSCKEIPTPDTNIDVDV